MPRRNLVRQNSFPYHVVSRSNNKDWFSIPMDIVWKIAKSSLVYANSRYEVKVHAFILMNNHYHLLLTTPGANIDLFMQAFNKNFSEKLKIASARINRMLGGPYKWSIIESERHLWNVIKYIYQNPMRAQICRSCEEYKYSTLVDKHFPLVVENNFDMSNIEFVNWINSEFDQVEVCGIRRALKKDVFVISKGRDSKKIGEFKKFC